MLENRKSQKGALKHHRDSNFRKKHHRNSNFRKQPPLLGLIGAKGELGGHQNLMTWKRGYEELGLRYLKVECCPVDGGT